MAAPRRPAPAPAPPLPAPGPPAQLRPPGQDWAPVGDIRRRASVTLDGSGNGTVNFDVRSSNQRYVITYCRVSTNQAQTTAPYPTAEIFEGTASAGLSDGATWTGNNDVFHGRFVMDCGTDLTVVFTGGIPGSVATAIIEGTNELRAELVRRHY